jgi:hypothetical protein
MSTDPPEATMKSLTPPEWILLMIYQDKLEASAEAKGLIARILGDSALDSALGHLSLESEVNQDEVVPFTSAAAVRLEIKKFGVVTALHYLGGVIDVDAPALQEILQITPQQFEKLNAELDFLTECWNEMGLGNRPFLADYASAGLGFKFTLPVGSADDTAFQLE